MSSSLIVEQLGKFHLIVVHFPIMLAMLLPAIMFASRYPWGEFWRKAVPWFVHFGAVAAVGTTILGLMLAAKRGALEGPLYLHRAFGLGASVLLVAMSAYLLLARPELQKRIPPILWILAIAGAAAVGLTGHFGGTSVHGELIILGRGTAAGEL